MNLLFFFSFQLLLISVFDYEKKKELKESVFKELNAKFFQLSFKRFGIRLLQTIAPFLRRVLMDQTIETSAISREERDNFATASEIIAG